jgi:glucosyl-dolichyl phosphate glucuronosyltransferase
MRVSVIVATWNRAELLARCLRALAAQTLPADQFEVLVVDNNSSDDTRAVVEASGPPVRYLFEARQGVSAARNTGLRAAAAPVVAFTDDDVVVPPDWLEALLARLETLPPEAAGVGGEVEPVWEVPPPEWLDPGYFGYLSARVSPDPTPRYLGEKDWLIECNVAYRRERLVEAGGLPEGLDRVGETLLSGGQVVNLVLAHAGHPMFFDPAITVRHDVPASRMTLEWLRRRAFWEGVSEHYKKQYLEQNGIPYLQNPVIAVPTSIDEWKMLMSTKPQLQTFRRVMWSAKALGFVIARMGLIYGR